MDGSALENSGAHRTNKDTAILTRPSEFVLDCDDINEELKDPIHSGYNSRNIYTSSSKLKSFVSQTLAEIGQHQELCISIIIHGLDQWQNSGHGLEQLCNTFLSHVYNSRIQMSISSSVHDRSQQKVFENNHEANSPGIANRIKSHFIYTTVLYYPTKNRKKIQMHLDFYRKNQRMPVPLTIFVNAPLGTKLRNIGDHSF